MPGRFGLRGVPRALVAALGLAMSLLANWGQAAPQEAPTAGSVDFDRDIQPILSDRCFQCHGPDAGQRQADLRLDTAEGILAPAADGGHVVVAGKPDQSRLYQRLSSTDPDLQMPPPDSGLKVTSQQAELIRRWIQQGAEYRQHWAFERPVRPQLPKVQKTAWPQQPLDYFVLADLDRHGLTPADEATKTTLIRRVSLDLTGLPPTPDEVDAFLEDTEPGAYERVVDRLLGSPAYGERMGAMWLDAARYADTNGYQTDGPRSMWRWRDWVIDAFNSNMPFDQFTIEQLAGDLLPNPTLEQRIATGFNRNHRGNAEGGIIPEEYAVEYVVDRIDTTATVWLGLTMACARCHDHKFDPITQVDFYRFYAFFNNVPENGKAVKYGNSPPMIKAPTRAQQQQLAALEAQLETARNHRRKLQPKISQALAQWETTLDAGAQAAAKHWVFDEHLIARLALDKAVPTPDAEQLPEKENAEQPKPPAETYPDGPPAYGPGKQGQAGSFDGHTFVAAGDVADFGFYDKFSLTAWVRTADETGGSVVSRMQDVAEGEGYDLRIHQGRLQLNLVKRWLDDSIRLETSQELSPGRWYHVAATYDGTRMASAVKLYLDGAEQPLNVLLDELNQSFETSAPLRIAAGGGPASRFHGMIDEVRVFDDVLSSDELQLIATAPSPGEILGIAAEKRSPAEIQKLETYFLGNAGPSKLRAAQRQVHELFDQRVKLIESFPSTMVMEELPERRATHVLLRGEYDKPGDQVTADVPEVLPSLDKDGQKDRLDLARWLVSPRQPLTSRVMVNRLWNLCFGEGLVSTSEDFGVQGERPSHGELLDWLAVEFVESGWDIKQLLRMIVTSATYRQSSQLTAELRQADPENRLLARGPRVRLSAEMIRDQALFASGLMTKTLGGPSVKPYQPAGLWEEVSGQKYERDNGPSLYRRSLYTYWKRTAAPPSMMTFDAAGRENCTVERSRTNTPLQALTLMNDVTYVEAARVLAARAMDEASDPEARMTRMFRHVTSRPPRAVELSILLASWKTYLAAFEQTPEHARQLTSAGESPRRTDLNEAEWAAYSAVAGLILNLDEAVTKE